MRAKIGVLTALVCAVVVGSSPGQRAVTSEASAASTAIIGATLVDVRTGEEIENSVVIIRGERIEKVGTISKLEIPKDARVVDARGKWILPGLIDMHVHLWGIDDSELLPLKLFLANGVTTIRDAGDSVLVMRLTREEIASGKRIGPRLFFCGDLLDGMPPLYRESTLLVDTPERARSAVLFLADQGVDCVKVYNSVKEPELKEIVRAARARNLPVIGHVPRTLTMTHAVELGMQGLEHIRVTGRELLPLDEAKRLDFLPFAERETRLWQRFEPQSEQMKGLVRFLAESRIVLDPTLAADESTFLVSHDDQIHNPNNHYLPAQLVDKWRAEPVPGFMRVPPELKESAIEGFEKRKQFVRMCSRDGVRIIAGTDGVGLGTLLPGFALQHELQLLVQSGLTPLEAIRAATINAAAALGREQDLGAIEPGHLADVLVLTADPMRKISNAQKIDLVIEAGRIYKPLDLLNATGGSTY